MNDNSNNIKKIIINSTFLYGAEIYRRIVRVALVIFAARLLGDANYGKFAFAMVLVKFFLIFSDAGIHQLLVRELARFKKYQQKYIGNAILIKIVLCLITTIAIIVIINLSNKPADVMYTVYYFTVSNIFASFSLVFQSIFQARQKMKYVAYSNMIAISISSIGGIGILLMGGDHVILAMIFAAGAFVKLCYCIFITLKKFIKIKISYDYNVIKFILKEGIPIGVNLILATIYTLIDQIMLSYICSDEAVGWYRAAYQFVFTMMVIPNELVKAAFPVLSKYFVTSIDDLKGLFNRLLKFLLLISLSLSTLLFLFSDDLIMLIYGNEYIIGAKALRILVWSTGLIFITLIFTNTTRATDRQRFTAKIVMIGTVINIGLNILLMPRYGVVGAAATTLITELFVFTVHYIYLSGYLFRPPVFRFLPKVLLINAVMVLSVFIFKRFGFFISFFLAIFVNIAMIFITSYFNKKEFDFFKNLFLRVKNRSRIK